MSWVGYGSVWLSLIKFSWAELIQMWLKGVGFGLIGIGFVLFGRVKQGKVESGCVRLEEVGLGSVWFGRVWFWVRVECIG